MPRIGKFIETESRIKVTRDWGNVGMGSYCLMGTGSLFGTMKEFWGWIVVMVAKHFECT